MAKTRAKHRGKQKTAPPRRPPPGWLSSDADELERRRQRGAAEAGTFQIANLEPQQPIFSTFRVRSTDSDYTVEVVSLSERFNLCDCPDHQVNGLGTCKHVEAVLLRLQQRSKRRYQQALAGGNPRIDITLDRVRDQVRVLWPARLTARSAAAKLIKPFFAADDTLLADPLSAVPALERALADAPPRVTERVRLSRQLAPWLRERRRRRDRDRARAMFTADLEQGKRSLDILKVKLFPYQQEGALHLAFTERALLADEMGLGKTAQAIAACELLRRLRDVARVLVIAPASLKAEWQEQIEKFTDAATVVIFGQRQRRLEQYRRPGFFYVCNYEQVLGDGPLIQQHLAPDVIILDEAQRIKNWQTKTAAAVKRLRSRYAFVLTGTPLENRIDEVYSIVQFLDPGLFGPLFRFNREFYQLDERGRPIGYKNLDRLHQKLRPVMLRRRKADVEGQLPGRSEKNYYVPMRPEQAEPYEEYSANVAKLMQIARQRALLPNEMQRLQRNLACMRMVCDTPYILDGSCRVAPKLDELASVLAELAENPDNKIIIFSEWRRMLELVRELADSMDLGYAWHTGSVAQPKRRREINRFKTEPRCRLFLSTDSGSTGLNLQNANVVVNLDLPWNPARLEQRIGRAWRKHQTRPVQVLNFICEDSIEQRMLQTLDRKQALADTVIDSGELDSMPLPSGRQAMVERLQGLIGDGLGGSERPAPAAAGEPEQPAAQAGAAQAGAAQAGAAQAGARRRLAEDSVARLSDRLQRLAVFEQNGSQTVLAVVDKADPATRNTVAGLTARQLPQAELQLFDRDTFAAVQKLIDAGVLQFAAGQELLPQDPTRTRREGEQRRRRLNEARRRLAEADRQRRMAGVLGAGGFPVEALTPLRAAVETALAALAHAAGEETQAPVATELIETRLLAERLLPADAAELVERLRASAAEPPDGGTAKRLLRAGDGLLEHAGRALDQASLRA